MHYLTAINCNCVHFSIHGLSLLVNPRFKYLAAKKNTKIDELMYIILVGVLVLSKKCCNCAKWVLEHSSQPMSNHREGFKVKIPFFYFRYSSHLGEARDFGTKKGLMSGFGMGFFQVIMFGSYALAFWYVRKRGSYKGTERILHLSEI